MIDVILDADILVFEAASHAETTVKWDGGFYSTFAHFDVAQRRFKDLVKMWVGGAVKALGIPDTVEHCTSYAFSNPDRSLSYRKHLPFISYKAERLGMKRPVVCKDLEAWAIEEFNGVWEPTLEGDDICGLWQFPFEECGEIKSIVVSGDKDMLTVPGFVFRPRDQSLHRVTAEAAEDAFLLQCIMGDKVDGYSGIPNVGPVRGKAILESAKNSDDLWGTIVKAYRAKGLSESIALDNARAARILRGDEYDWTTKEVKLWTP